MFSQLSFRETHTKLLIFFQILKEGVIKFHQEILNFTLIFLTEIFTWHSSWCRVALNTWWASILILDLRKHVYRPSKVSIKVWCPISITPVQRPDLKLKTFNPKDCLEEEVNSLNQETLNLTLIFSLPTNIFPIGVNLPWIQNGASVLTLDLKKHVYRLSKLRIRVWCTMPFTAVWRSNLKLKIFIPKAAGLKEEVSSYDSTKKHWILP